MGEGVGTDLMLVSPNSQCAKECKHKQRLFYLMRCVFVYVFLVVKDCMCVYFMCVWVSVFGGGGGVQRVLCR